MSVNQFGFSLSAPATAPSGVADTTSGDLGTGNYRYKVSYVTVHGETLCSSATSAIAAAGDSIALSSIPVSTNANVIGRKLYRTAVGGSTYLLCATIADNTTTTYVDGLADGSLDDAEPVINSSFPKQTVGGVLSAGWLGITTINQALTAFATGGQANATLLNCGGNRIATCATNADSVKLPLLSSSMIGMAVFIRNDGAANAAVFPNTDQTINGGSANASITIKAGTSAVLVAQSATNWTRVL